MKINKIYCESQMAFLAALLQPVTCNICGTMTLLVFCLEDEHLHLLFLTTVSRYLTCPIGFNCLRCAHAQFGYFKVPKSMSTSAPRNGSLSNRDLFVVRMCTSQMEIDVLFPVLLLLLDRWYG